MRCYLKYFKYVLEHKKNVFIECWKEGLYFHAFTHDLSKLSPKEFFAYANYDFQNPKNNSQENKNNFKKAWQHHKDNNMHHWNYWHERNLKMPTKYIKQMICDWKAMSRKFSGTAQEYYLKNYKYIKLDRNSRYLLEVKLGFYVEGCCECDQEFWQTIEEVIISSLKYEKNNPDTFDKKWFYEDYLKNYLGQWNVNMLEILNTSE